MSHLLYFMVKFLSYRKLLWLFVKTILGCMYAFYGLDLGYANEACDLAHRSYVNSYKGQTMRQQQVVYFFLGEKNKL